MSSIGFVGNVGNDMFNSGGDWNQVRWGRTAVLVGSLALIAGGAILTASKVAAPIGVPMIWIGAMGLAGLGLRFGSQAIQREIMLQIRQLKGQL